MAIGRPLERVVVYRVAQVVIESSTESTLPNFERAITSDRSLARC